jgi:hypothetical protein
VSGAVPPPSLTAEEVEAAAPPSVAPTRQELEAAGQTDLVNELGRLQAEDLALAAEQQQRGDLFPDDLEAATSDDRMVAGAMGRQQVQEDGAQALEQDAAEAVELQGQEQLDLLGPFDPFEQGATVSQQTSPGVAPPEPLTAEDVAAAKAKPAKTTPPPPPPPPPPTPPSAAVTPTKTTPPPPPPPPTTPMQFGSEKAANAAARQIATELGLNVSDADLAALVKPIIRFALPRREPAIREALQKMVPATPAATTPAATTPAATTPAATTPAATTPAATTPAATTPAVTAPEQEFRAKVARVISNADQAKLADAYQTVVGEAPPADVKTAVKKFSLPEQVAVANEFNSIMNRPLFELPGRFEEKTNFSISGAGTFDPNSPQINQALGAGSYSTDLFPYISDFDSALNAIVKYASNPAQREIAQKLAARIPQLEQLGFKFSLKVTQDGYQITGGASGVSRIRHYQLGANTSIEITLNHPSNGVNSGTGWVTVAHEIAHAATQAQLTYAPQGTAAVQLRALFNDVVSHLAEKAKRGTLTAFEKKVYNKENNALGNPDELLAWGLTDPEMQQWLDSIKSKNGSFLSRLFDVVASALGFSKNDTAFSELLSIADNLLTESFVPYIEAANARGRSFGRQENLTNHPTWALWAAEARPIVWSAPDAALVEAETLSGNTIYILATPQGTSQVDVSKYTGKMLPPARLKLIQKIAAGLTKTSPSMNKTAQVAEEVIFNDTPQSNSLFLKTQGAQLNSTSKPMRSKPVRDAVAKVMGTTSGSSAADAARAVLTWGLPLPALNDYVKSYIGKRVQRTSFLQTPCSVLRIPQ